MAAGLWSSALLSCWPVVSWLVSAAHTALLAAHISRPPSHPPSPPHPRRKGGTFRSVKNVPVGAKGLTLKQHIEHTLGTGAVEDAVRLPPGEDMNEWLAVNTGGKAGWLSWLASLGQGAVGEAVRLPLGEGMNEWPAVNTGGPVCLSR